MILAQTIYINGRFLTHGVTGVQRYGLELIKSIDRLAERKEEGFEHFEFVVLSPKAKLPELGLNTVKIKQVGLLNGNLWEQLELPFYSAGGFLLNPCNTAPAAKRNQAVTMHDAAVYAVPDTYSKAFKLWYKTLFPVIGLMSRHVLTCSMFSKDQLIRYCGIKPSKIEVIHHGREHVLSTPADPRILKKYGINKPFVLAVSSMSPNKNFSSVVKAIEYLDRSDFDFVIAGGTNPKLFKEQGELPDSVKYLGYVEEGELRALYEQAACFVFPSFYEGFGFPPLEAMACGCPVVASRTASIPEVCGDAAIYCDPHDFTDIARGIEQVMDDPALQLQLKTKGLKQAARFSWEKCARETLTAITEPKQINEVLAKEASGGSRT